MTVHLEALPQVGSQSVVGGSGPAVTEMYEAMLHELLDLVVSEMRVPALVVVVVHPIEFAQLENTRGSGLPISSAFTPFLPAPFAIMYSHNA